MTPWSNKKKSQTAGFKPLFPPIPGEGNVSKKAKKISEEKAKEKAKKDVSVSTHIIDAD